MNVSPYKYKDTCALKFISMVTFTILKLLIKKTDQDKIDETRSNKSQKYKIHYFSVVFLKQNAPRN